MKFRDPANNNVETFETQGLYAFLFGPLYFLSKGARGHALISVVLAIMTFGMSWIVCAFAAMGIIRTMYLRRGWVEVMNGNAE